MDSTRKVAGSGFKGWGDVAVTWQGLGFRVQDLELRSWKVESSGNLNG